MMVLSADLTGIFYKTLSTCSIVQQYYKVFPNKNSGFKNRKMSGRATTLYYSLNIFYIFYENKFKILTHDKTFNFILFQIWQISLDNTKRLNQNFYLVREFNFVFAKQYKNVAKIDNKEEGKYTWKWRYFK